MRVETHWLTTERFGKRCHKETQPPTMLSIGSTCRDSKRFYDRSSEVIRRPRMLHRDLYPALESAQSRAGRNNRARIIALLR
jgi:hypothetical protein